jgi:NAD(P)H-hydrate epimerase
MQIPHVTAEQMGEVDRLMVETYGIQLIQMMENAGQNLARLARRMVGDVTGRRIAVFCGAGNNGGGGMVAARHLHNWGAQVALKLAADPESLGAVAGRQLAILQALTIESQAAPEPHKADLILDALIGYSLAGDPREPVVGWIERINAAGRPVLALDLPSGLDATTGEARRPCVRATATMTLALPKTGLLAAGAKPYVGDLYLADIGVPPELYALPSIGLAVGALFAAKPIIRVAKEAA